jgi:hypothetical protein
VSGHSGGRLKAFLTSFCNSSTSTLWPYRASLPLHWTPSSLLVREFVPNTSTPACGWPLRPFACVRGSSQTALNRSRANRSKACQSAGAGRWYEERVTRFPFEQVRMSGAESDSTLDRTKTLLVALEFKNDTTGSVVGVRTGPATSEEGGPSAHAQSLSSARPGPSGLRRTKGRLPALASHAAA